MINKNNVPQELREKKIWLLWRTETRTDSSGSRKPTKVPINAAGMRTGIDAAHENDWMTLEEALLAAEKTPCSGIGFKIPENVFFLDIDHRAPEDPLVQTLFARFNSYAERSCSGTGFHIYGRYDPAAIPTEVGNEGKRKLSSVYYSKNPKNGIELYFGGLTNRFAVFTGDCIYDAPMRDCTDALLVTLEEEMRRETGAPAPDRRAEKSACMTARPSRLAFSEPDEEDIGRLISRLSGQKNGGKFKRLFQEGNISGYGSQSEADLALCSMIAFRTGDNPKLIDRIFRLSALYREKWEREDYRESTIRLAIESCGGNFCKTALHRPYFITENDRGEEKVSAPLLAQYVRENLQYIMVRSSAREELMIYVYENGVYRLTDDKMFKGIIRNYIEAYDVTLVKMSILKEVYELLQTDHGTVGMEKLNSQWNLINFENGLLKIGDGRPVLLPHSPEVYSTIRIPCVWQEEPIPTPVFDSFLETLCSGDAGVRQLLLEYMGAVLSNIPGYRMKKALFLVGEGNTGKSRLKRLMEKLLGEGNYMGIDLRELENRFGTGRIYDKRLAGSADLSFMTLDELSTFKKLTGGDSIFAEDKGKQGFEFTFSGLLWFCMNRLPRFGGDNGQWVYDRILTVKCTNVIPPEKQDKELDEKLFAEREGIVQKAVAAVGNVIRNGFCFTEPPSVILCRREYRAGNSTVYNFFYDCMCQKSDTYNINEDFTVTEVYKAYKEYCRVNNNGFARTKKEFDLDLAEILGCTPQELTRRRKNGVVYVDYTLTPEARSAYCRS